LSINLRLAPLSQNGWKIEIGSTGSQWRYCSIQVHWTYDAQQEVAHSQAVSFFPAILVFMSAAQGQSAMGMVIVFCFC